MMLFGPYQLAGRLAKGGLCEIYRAMKPGPRGFQRGYALKWLHPHHASVPERVEMLIEEARLGAPIRHANLLQTDDLVQHEDGRWAIVLELVDGMNLAVLNRLLREDGRLLGLGELVYIACELLEGLSYLHGVHRFAHADLSPSNVMLSVEGDVKIVDFGQQALLRLRSLRRQGSPSGSLSIGGKLRYLAPETLSSGAVTPQSDLYALGLILWELMSGVRLYEGLGIRELSQRVMAGGVPRLSNASGDLPEPLLAMLHWLLQVDPNKRPPEAGVLLAQLEGLGFRRSEQRRRVARWVREFQVRSHSSDLPVLLPRSGLEAELTGDLMAP